MYSRVLHWEQTMLLRSDDTSRCWTWLSSPLLARTVESFLCHSTLVTGPRWCLKTATGWRNRRVGPKLLDAVTTEEFRRQIRLEEPAHTFRSWASVSREVAKPEASCHLMKHFSFLLTHFSASHSCLWLMHWLAFMKASQCLWRRGSWILGNEPKSRLPVPCRGSWDPRSSNVPHHLRKRWTARWRSSWWRWRRRRERWTPSTCTPCQIGLWCKKNPVSWII